MMRDGGASAFAHNRRMGDTFGVAYVHDVPDHVVRVFLERIIGRTVKIAARSIIIDAKPAAHVEITEFVSEFGKLCVISRTFAHGALDRRNIRYLRSDVEMKKFEAMRQAGILQHLAGGDEIGCVETELRVLAAARGPFAGAFAVQASANSNVRLDHNLLRGANDLLNLFQLFCDNDNRLPQFAAKQGYANESRILVAIADNQTLGIFLHRKSRNELRFTACFESKMKLFACIDNLLDNFAQLIHLDGKNAAIAILITELRYCALKCAID